METATFTYITQYKDGSESARDYVFTLDTKIYVNVKSVSRSGITSHMSFYMIENDSLVNITHIIAECLDDKFNDSDRTIKVQSYNMNMIFKTLYDFANKLRFRHQPRWVENYYII